MLFRSVINRRLIEKATAGDTRAILKVVEMRERYAASRAESLAEMIRKARYAADNHKSGYKKMSEEEVRLNDARIRLAEEAKYLAKTPPMNPFAGSTDAEIAAGRERLNRDRKFGASHKYSEPDEDPLA